jgi:FSR family fosmidomycin resistance protein-like MFS transporter
MSAEPNVLDLAAADRGGRIVRSGLVALALFSLGHFFVDIYSSALGAFQPVLVDKLGISLTQAGILGGLLAFSASIMQPAYGYLSDRFHTRLFTALAPGVAGIFIASLGTASSFAWLIPLILLGGAGIASFHPQASARATAGITQNRGRWMAVFISSGTLGFAFGPTMFSALFAHLGSQRSYWGALPGVLMTVLLLVCLPETPLPERKRAAFDWSPLRAVWKPLTILYFLVFIRSIIQIVFAQFLPLYLYRERGFSIEHASWALSLYLFSGAAGGFAGGHLADRLGGRKVILISMISCVPFLTLFFLSRGIVAMIGLALAGLTLLFTIPVNVVMAQDLVPTQAGTASALMMGFSWGMAGLFFIPLTGWLGDHFTMHFALGILTLFPIIGIFLTLKLPK